MREKNICFSKLAQFTPVKSTFPQMTIPFLFMAESSNVCMYYIFLTHSAVVGNQGWFTNYYTVNSTAINIAGQVSLSYADLDYFV